MKSAKFKEISKVHPEILIFILIFISLFVPPVEAQELTEDDPCYWDPICCWNYGPCCGDCGYNSCGNECGYCGNEPCAPPPDPCAGNTNCGECGNPACPPPDPCTSDPICCGSYGTECGPCGRDSCPPPDPCAGNTNCGECGNPACPPPDPCAGNTNCGECGNPACPPPDPCPVGRGSCCGTCGFDACGTQCGTCRNEPCPPECVGYQGQACNCNSCGQCSSYDCSGNCGPTPSDPSGQSCGYCGYTTDCSGRCPSDPRVSCGYCGMTADCSGMCPANPSGQFCGYCGLTTDCSGGCPANPSWQSCGYCGYTTDCSGRCPSDPRVSCGYCGMTADCNGNCPANPSGQSCGYCGLTTDCSGGCPANPSGQFCGYCGYTTDCSGMCPANPSGQSCGYCGLTTDCSGGCPANPSGQSCGYCGYTTDCSGMCPSDPRVSCGYCGMTADCNGNCPANPSGQSCGYCGLTTDCSGGCPANPSGQFCGSCGGETYCDGSCSLLCGINQVCYGTPASCCTPNCNSKTCGSDGCGGSCGTCPDGQTCSNENCVSIFCPDGNCVPGTSDCTSGTEIKCIFDYASPGGFSCGKRVDVGNWCLAYPSTPVLMPDCSCGCTPNCNGKQCGSDGCVGSCGPQTANCPLTYGTCSVTGTKTCSGTSYGTCQGTDPRPANCAGKKCGDDGCGGSCGTCTYGCTSGQCNACASSGDCGNTVKPSYWCSGTFVCGPENSGPQCGSAGGPLYCYWPTTCVDCAWLGMQCSGGTCVCPQGQKLVSGQGCCASNIDTSCGSCGGTIKCDGTCSVPNPIGYGTSCGNCGLIGCNGCAGEGVCSPSSTQCSNGVYQSCSSGCGWQNSGTDGDGDGVDNQCEPVCQNARGVCDSDVSGKCIGKSGEVCNDGLDNDCDGYVDATDSDCTLTLTLSPNPANPNQAVIAAVSRSYSLGSILVRDYRGCSYSGGDGIICTISAGSTSCSFNSPTNCVYTYGYHACVGQNDAPATLAVTCAPDHCSSSSGHSSGDTINPSKYRHYYITSSASWNYEDCNWLDNNNCFSLCNTGSGNIDTKCNDYYCNSAACSYSGSDWTKVSNAITCPDTCTGEASVSYQTSDADLTDANKCSSGQSSCPSTTWHDSCSADTLNEYYCSSNSGTPSSKNCNDYDGWTCNGNVREYRDFSCTDPGGSNGAYCRYTVTQTEDCSTKLSSDSDGSASAYRTAGIVTDYLTCSGAGACTSAPYSDSCSGSSLTEYGAVGSGTTSSNPAYDCKSYNTKSCINGQQYEKIWGCQSVPGFCYDTGSSNHVGNDADLDLVDQQCNDATCENAKGVCDSAVSGKCIAKTATETACSDGLDNDCDGITDCADPNCAKLAGPGGKTCCQSAVSDCIQSTCVIETCDSNQCNYQNRDAGATDECGTCQACNVAGGSCTGLTANEGKSCAGACSYCNAGTCTDRVSGATDECGTCQSCNIAGAGGVCAGISAETGKGCTTDCYDCVSGSCSATTENNDGSCNDDCTRCNSGSCISRSQCETGECSAGQYCDDAGGNCQTPDQSSAVCLNCASDSTNGLPWTWNPGNHQDAGKSYAANLFDSSTGPCTVASGGSCFDANGNAANHKAALTTGNCCGDDASEYYKLDYYGPECTGSVNDCVWSTGEAQDSNTGNAEYWCYLHEWSQCTDSAISTKVGGVCCAGTTGSSDWTVLSQVKTEDKYSCNDGLDNDCDGNPDCADSDCAKKKGPGGATCCKTATSDCTQNNCVIESCANNICTYSNRNQCDGSECPAGQYCDAAGGTCNSPETSQNVCLNCPGQVPDQTSGLPWTWNPANHQDAGMGYASKLFDSNNGPCLPASCTKSGNDCHCFDANNNNVNHKAALATGTCCGNNANEFYKLDYYELECVNDVNDCVWSTGEAQASNTGNAQYWCYLHEWNECLDSAIGTKVGGVTCAGIVGNNAWTPNSLVKPENQYSCTDTKDNDGDGLIDCADPDCAGSISGTVRNQETSQPIASADVSAKVGLASAGSSTTTQSGTYSINPLNCGTYNIAASHPDYAPSTKTVALNPNQQMNGIDFMLALGSACEADCTYASDNIVHEACDGKGGCAFYDATAKAACDNSQPGWARDYDSTHYVICGTGSPQLKIEIQASVSCDSGTLVKVTRIVAYNGKPAKLVVATCG